VIGEATRREDGFSLLELMIAAAILVVVILGTGSVITTTTRQNFMVREDAAAMRAARAKLAEIQAYTYDDIVAEFGSGYTFRVLLVDGTTQSLGLEVSGAQQDEGEVVIIQDETPAEASYGRDLNNDSVPDGVDLNSDGQTNGVISAPGNSIFPLDLNGTNGTADNSVAAASMNLIPVVVVVRWRSMTGIERRIQLMSVIGRP